MKLQLLCHPHAVLGLQHVLSLVREDIERTVERGVGKIWFFVIEQFKKCNPNFVKIQNYSNMNKWGILDKLIKKYQEKKD